MFSFFRPIVGQAEFASPHNCENPLGHMSRKRKSSKMARRLKALQERNNDCAQVGLRRVHW